MAMALPAPAESKGSAFGVTSFVFAGLTVLAPVLIMVFFGARALESAERPSHSWEPLGLVLAGGVLSIIAAGASSLVGSVAGTIALLRGERRIWRAIFGLVVNLPVLLFMLYMYVTAQMNNGG
ncbi:unnamed protein product [Gemmata massiliana]|uniref:Uncharacterized protein n=1 Tax=Gemmata massiliana TaxID=1210884 RepID=A0A6P2D8I1_9BACT|nr:hypothetical protein [Gemmata massiliana]VTR97157.1 unnamed protein product [Gemmata massiliana]